MFRILCKFILVTNLSSFLFLFFGGGRGGGIFRLEEDETVEFSISMNPLWMDLSFGKIANQVNF